MAYDKNVSPVGWYFGSYLLRFVELEDADKDNLERRFHSWENTVLVKARSIEVAFAKIEKLAKASCKPYKGGAQGVQVKWEYVGITEVLPVHEEIADGAEIAWKERAPRTLRKLKELVRTRASIRQ